jgi:hypothetical protein
MAGSSFGMSSYDSAPVKKEKQLVHIPFCCNEFCYRISSRPLRNHPRSEDRMILGDFHFFAVKDCPYEYSITSLSLRYLSPYATKIRHLFENGKTVSE